MNKSQKVETRPKVSQKVWNTFQMVINEKNFQR